MSQPKAIYASVPPICEKGPEWIGTQPVVVANPFPFWPSLDWTGDHIGDPQVTKFTEVPQYLWLQPVADPVNTITCSFKRRWIGTETHKGFTPRMIERGTYDIMIYIAADNEYRLFLRKNGVLLEPSGDNTNVPTCLPWRNVKTYRYEDVFIHCSTILELETVVTNIGQSPSTLPNCNPAMFTWVMQLNKD